MRLSFPRLAVLAALSLIAAPARAAFLTETAFSIAGRSIVPGSSSQIYSPGDLIPLSYSSDFRTYNDAAMKFSLSSLPAYSAINSGPVYSTINRATLTLQVATPASGSTGSNLASLSVGSTGANMQAITLADFMTPTPDVGTRTFVLGQDPGNPITFDVTGAVRLYYPRYQSVLMQFFNFQPGSSLGLFRSATLSIDYTPPGGTTVPEPMSAALAGIGVGLALASRCRSSRPVDPRPRPRHAHGQPTSDR